MDADHQGLRCRRGMKAAPGHVNAAHGRNASAPLMRAEHPARTVSLRMLRADRRPGRASHVTVMTTPSSTTSPQRPGNWLANQPYLLLSLTALFWAGNAIV